MIRAFTLLLSTLCVLGLGSTLHAQEAEAVDFETEILPILEENCWDCHRAPYRTDSGRLRKPRGGLRIDGASFLLEGGNDGPAVVPGNARQSPLFQRIVLPEDDGDLMPEDGPRLPQAAIDKIGVWINGGAEFGSWIGEGAELTESAAPPPASETEELYQRLAEGVSPVEDATLESIRREFGDGRIQLRALDTESRLWRVQFSAHRRSVDDEALSVLASIRENVAELDLSDTRITDRVASAIAAMPSLVRLQLDRTAISGRTIDQLGDLPELRVLHLVGCEQVKDAQLASIQKLENITRIYVWKSGLSRKAIRTLRSERPGLRVFGAPDLPQPDSEGEPGPQGRRRR
ncbi:MAG: c-type cytochrome domain-containing protein [Planctomycetota bacterium]